MKIRSNSGSGLSGIREKIAAAQGLLPDGKTAILQDADLGLLLERVLEKASASRVALIDCGVAAACRRCEEDDGGSCCGAGIENRYSVALLLINLLLGAALPEERRFENSCHFLGEKGCCLLARDTICVNYLCRAAVKTLAHGDLVALQNIVGEEMDAIFTLHEAIKKSLRR